MLKSDAADKAKEGGNEHLLSLYSMLGPFHTMSHLIFTYYDENIIS